MSAGWRRYRLNELVDEKRGISYGIVQPGTFLDSGGVPILKVNNLSENRTNAPEKLEYYGHVADGGAYPAINPKLIMDIDVVVPIEDVLNNFQSIAYPLFEEINNNNHQSNTLAKIRNVLLPKLMNGEISVEAIIGAMITGANNTRANTRFAPTVSLSDGISGVK